MVDRYDAIVIGSGPNGLAAAITLAQRGKSVIVYEAEDEIGGGVRSAELTLPGFVHDVCSAVYPLAAGSPFFRSLPLARYGLEWIEPEAALAHPFDDGTAVTVERSVARTAEQLGEDRDAYSRLMTPLVRAWRGLDVDLLGPLRFPSQPWSMARFGMLALQPASRLARRWFSGTRARALFAGLGAHAMLPLELRPSAAFGLVLGITAHGVGWPIARGGARRLSAALASYLRSLGGEIVVSRRVRNLNELPSSRVVLCDVTPRQLLDLAGERLPEGYRKSLRRYRYGMGAFKVDWALGGPVPWRAPECTRAATVHLGGSLEEIALSERAAWNGQHAERPYVLLAQPSLFDPLRAPPGTHTLWGYCHVPNGSTVDMTESIERQIERFAPGFRDLVIARHTMSPAALEKHNGNLIGGDINGGAPLLGQLFLRPTRRIYRTPVKGLYICSAATPPGGGVHGMCGHFAALQALRDAF
ncbi:MAG TPA: NAD(P)/FAD-dependent oxidoreductase [candidate division Zixibacteria bacterium]|nr:NAD(P)/FAD-dependent oxidoreductase [candidate division Zixibacteria bacterium]